MLQEKTGIGPGLMFVLLFSSVFGYGLAQTPDIAARYIGSNGYLGVILAFLIYIGVMFAAIQTGRRFPDKSMIEYLPVAFGRFIGKMLGFVYLVFLLSLVVWSLKFVVSYMGTFFLNRTPVGVITMLVLLTTLYVAHKGIEVIARLAAFVFPLSIIFIAAALIFSLQSLDVQQIRPVFMLDASKLSVGTLHIFNMFFPAAVLFTVYKYQTEQQKGPGIIIGAGALVALIMFFVVFGTIGVFGAKGTLRYSWPFLELVRKTHIPYILQTFNLFFSITWFTQIIVGMSAIYFALAEGTHQLIENLNYKWIALLLFPVIYILTFVFNSDPTWRLVHEYYRIIGFAVILLLPLAVWLGTALTGRGEPAR